MGVENILILSLSLSKSSFFKQQNKSKSFSLSINNNKQQATAKKFIHRYGVLHYWVNIKQNRSVKTSTYKTITSLSLKNFLLFYAKKECINFYYQSTEKSIYTNHTQHLP